jgi:hypothetical protein
MIWNECVIQEGATIGKAQVEEEEEEEEEVCLFWSILTLHQFQKPPNKQIQAMTLRVYIPETLCSNHGRATYPDWSFSWFSSVPPNVYKDSVLKGVTNTYFQILSN